jgi:hypothetical protein
LPPAHFGPPFSRLARTVKERICADGRAGSTLHGRS